MSAQSSIVRLFAPFLSSPSKSPPSTLSKDNIRVHYVVPKRVDFDFFNHELVDANLSGPNNLIVPL